jgi:hypothetical protein
MAQSLLLLGSGFIVDGMAVVGGAVAVVVVVVVAGLAAGVDPREINGATLGVVAAVLTGCVADDEGSNVDAEVASSAVAVEVVVVVVLGSVVDAELAA